MSKLTVSAIQMDIKLGEVRDNFQRASKLIEKAIERKSDLVVLPEMWPTGFAYPDLFKIALTYQDSMISFMADVASRGRMIVVGGSIPEVEGEKLFNTCFVISPERKILGSFRKVHLFSPNEEDKYFHPGDKVEVIQTPPAKIGITICYDLRFPEVARSLALKGTQILFVPAEFPCPRENHFVTLLKARAIENQFFVVGANRVGKDKRQEYFGHSMIVDPYGEVIEEVKGAETVLTASINLEKIEEVRKAVPCLEERKPEVYGL